MSNVWHFFPLQGTTGKHNNNISTSTHIQKATIHAHHVVSGNPFKEVRMKCPLIVETVMKYNSKYELYKISFVAVGLLYVLSWNQKFIVVT